MNIKEDLTLSEYIKDSCKPKLVHINPYYPLNKDEYIIVKYLRDAEALIRDEYGHLAVRYRACENEQSKPYSAFITFSMFDSIFTKVTVDKPLYIKEYLNKITQ